MYFDPVETGKRIKGLRDKHELTQIEFAEKINVDRSFVSKMETGIKSPSIDLLVEIAVMFDVTTDYLLMGKSMDSRLSKEEVREMAERLFRFADRM